MARNTTKTSPKSPVRGSLTDLAGGEIYGLIVESSNDIIAIVDSEGIFHFMNRRAADALGGKAEQFIGKTMWDLFPQPTAERQMNSIRQAIETGEALVAKAPAILHGETRWYQTNIQPLKSPPKQPPRALVIATDIHKLQMTEEALRASEERYRQVTENAGEGIGIVDENGTVLYANPMMEWFFGFPIGKMPGALITDFFSEDQIPIIQAQMERRRRGEPGTYILTARRADGSQRLIQITATPWMGEEGQCKGSFTVIRDITEQSRAEKELAESEGKYRNLVELASDGICIMQDMFIHYANPRLGEMLGTSPERMLSRTFVPFIHPEERTKIQELYRRHVENGERELGIQETRMVRADGQIIDVEINGSIIVFEGKPAELVTIRDVTDRKRAEAEIARKESLLRLLMNTTSDIAFLMKPDGTLLIANRWLAESLGLSSESLDNANFFDLRSPETSQRRRQLAKQVIASKKPAQLLYENGGRHYDVFAYPVLGPREEVEALAVFVRDTTEKKRAEEEVARKENLLRVLLDATHDVAFLMDLKGTLLAFNNRFAAGFGRSPKELQNAHAYSLISPEAAKSRRAQIEKVLTEKTPIHFRDQREGRYYDNNVYPVFDGGDRIAGLAVFARDVTSQVRAEAERNRYQEQLRLLASKLTLAEEHERRRIARLLHDGVNQNLALLAVSLKKLTGETDLPALHRRLEEAAAQISRAAEEVRAMTFELSPPELDSLGFADAVRWLVEKMSRDLRLDSDFHVQSAELPIGEDVKVLLFHILRELLINIGKHAEATRVFGSLAAEDQYLRITIGDNGKGFDPLQPLAMEHSGGFGLFAIRERLKHVGGELTIEASPSDGTQVTVRIPVGSAPPDGET